MLFAFLCFELEPDWERMTPEFMMDNFELGNNCKAGHYLYKCNPIHILNGHKLLSSGNVCACKEHKLTNLANV